MLEVGIKKMMDTFIILIVIFTLQKILQQGHIYQKHQLKLISALKLETKKLAIEHIDKIWGRLNEMIPFLDFKEFILILEQAKKLRVYGYVNLDPSLFPYVYATLINFLPSKGKNKLRKLKFCFFFESTVKQFDELWIDRGKNSQFSRISYKGTDAKKYQYSN